MPARRVWERISARFRWSPFADFSFKEVKDILFGRNSANLCITNYYFFPDTLLFLLCQYVHYYYCAQLEEKYFCQVFFRTLWWATCSLIFLLPLLVDEEEELELIHALVTDGARIAWGALA